jgi:hypothetical protein
MDLELIGVAAGGVLAGGLAAGGLGAWWWGGKLGHARHQISKLEQLRQFTDQQGQQVRKQIEQLQSELNDLRIQATRARTREAHAIPATVIMKRPAEELLLRDEPAASAGTPAEPFATTQILPRSR